METIQMPELTGTEKQVAYATDVRGQLSEMWNKPEFQGHMKADYSKVCDQLNKVAHYFFFVETDSGAILNAYSPFKNMGNPSYDVLRAYYRANKHKIA